MCGICGRYNFGVPNAVRMDELRKMNSLMIHRGPDDEGYLADGNLGLAMRRLSIIDLATGHQPIPNEDETCWVVLNGEIYNFQELKGNLIKKGHKFRTKTDAEVVVHLYEEMGVDCVKPLRGMFAFAIWDKRKKRLMLSRDRIGKKPLLYTLQPGWIAFASELRALLPLEGVSKEIDCSAIDYYLSLQYIPSPLTIFKSIKKLPPAHTLIVENGKVRIERYWDLPLRGMPPGSTGPRPDFEEAKEALVEKLTEATRLRMISDVPLGAFLSGGIDSSIVVALMSRLSDRPVNTFSIGFEEAEFSELEYAGEIAKMYGCNHHEFIVKAEMADILPKIAWHYSEPYADPSALPSYYVAQQTRKFVTVALNGDGGDENFGGYLRYKAMKLAHYWDILPQGLRKAVSAAVGTLPEKNAPTNIIWRARRFLRSGAAGDMPARQLEMVSFFRPDEKEEILTERMKSELGASLHGAKEYFARLVERTKNEDFVNRLLYIDMRTYLPECLMTKMDIATMANSLEGRSPFLDHEFMEFVFSLPGNWKLKGLNNSKWILREAFKNLLPKKIYTRGKQGFGIPLGPWFRGQLKTYWEEHCLSKTAIKRDYFKEESLRKLWNEHQSGKRDHGFRLWALLMLELWHQAYSP